MARINVEDQLFTDGRFKIFSQGKDEALAIGQMVILWRLAQTYWIPNKKFIPKNVFYSLNFAQDLINSDLVIEINEEIYVKGSENQFNWWFSKQNNGKLGGRPRKNKTKKTERKPSEKLPLTDSKASEKLNRSYENPQSTIYNLQSQSQVVVDNNAEQKETEEIWNQVQYSFGYPRDIFNEVVYDAYLIYLSQDPSTRKWKRFLSHYLKNEKEAIRQRILDVSKKQSDKSFSLEEWKNQLFEEGGDHV